MDLQYLGGNVTAAAAAFQRRASVHRLVASSTASTALRSALSLISHVPVSNCASRPPTPCTATSTNLRSNASMICAPSSATELSGSRMSRHSDAARAAASTRLRIVSVPCSSAVASRPSNDSFTRTITRCGRSDGRTSSPWKITTRRLARDLTASSCICSIGRTSAVWATLILRWSILRPSCAISADSMFRTTCFGCVTPLGEVSEIHVLTLADTQPRHHHPGGQHPGQARDQVFGALDPPRVGDLPGHELVLGRPPPSLPGGLCRLRIHASPFSGRDLIAPPRLRPVQPPVGRHHHVLPRRAPPRPEPGP